MSDQFKFELYLQSPRWGTIIIYHICMELDRMTIGKLADSNPSICSWHEGELCIWSCPKPHDPSRNPIVSKLQEDLIQPPVIFARALEAAWRAWRIGLLEDEEVQYQMSELFEWVNIVSASRPRTDFWRKLF